uniref:Uncharacterized protein n=1 Tax=Ixodes ricinus TaxID=34613 RepID=A0A6B0U8T7_IXORI
MVWLLLFLPSSSLVVVVVVALLLVVSVTTIPSFVGSLAFCGVAVVAGDIGHHSRAGVVRCCDETRDADVASARTMSRSSNPGNGHPRQADRLC